MAKNRIFLGPADGVSKPLITEGLAVDGFLPGILLKQTAAGLATSDIVATTFSSECIVALEYGEHTDQGATSSVYVVGQTALGGVARSGEFYNVRVAAGQNITSKGVALSSNGDGTLKIATVPATVGVTSEQILFYSDEIVNTGAGVVLVQCRKA